MCGRARRGVVRGLQVRLRLRRRDQHPTGYLTRYGHNSRNLVRVGQTVQKGDAIAVIGSTGRSTGTHVHFEVERDGKVLNPSRYLAVR